MGILQVFFLLLFSTFCCSTIAQRPITETLTQDFDVPPLFEDCYDPLESVQALQNCSHKKLFSFFQKHLVYPEKAKSTKLEGLVVLSLIIDEQGEIVSTELIRDIGEGCGLEAMRIARQLPKFSPAQKNGQPLKARLIFPIRFQLKQQESIYNDDKYQMIWGNIIADSIATKEIKQKAIQPFSIRNNQGESLKIENIVFVYIHKKQVKQAEGAGNQLNEAMLNYLSKAKKGSFLVLTFTLRDKKGLVDFVREWKLY